MGGRISYLRFEHNGKDYRYNSDKIEYRNLSYEKGDEDYGIDEWNGFIDIPLSSTKYATSKKDIETICILALNAYEQGRNRGKRDKQIEICEVIGADY